MSLEVVLIDATFMIVAFYLFSPQVVNPVPSLASWDAFLREGM